MCDRPAVREAVQRRATGVGAIFDTNVLGTLNVIAEAVPVMRSAGGGGAIVTFASVDAFAVSRGQLIYSAAKAAVLSLTRHPVRHGAALQPRAATVLARVRLPADRADAR